VKTDFFGHLAGVIGSNLCTWRAGPFGSQASGGQAVVVVPPECVHAIGITGATRRPL